jgi:chaperone modulatory protein CbpM
MKTEPIEALPLDEQLALSIAELSELSGLAQAELQALVEHGALAPLDPGAARWQFSARCVVSVRRACRLRRDFDLNDDALALALTLVERLRQMEDELRALRAQMPRRPR